MGEKIKDLDSFKIGDAKFLIELNESASGSRYRDIHIQNNKFRLEIPENEFLQMAACVLLAKEQLCKIKGINQKTGEKWSEK